MSRWGFLLAGIAGVSALVVGAAAAGAAPPARGTIVEGRGAAGVALGSPVAAARRAWGLQCGGRLGPTEVSGNCSGVREGGGTRYVVTVAYDQLGRVVTIGATDPGWTTPRGIGPGRSMAQLRAAYGAGLRVRVTRTWTYAELVSDRRVGESRYRTSFIASTHSKKIVDVILSQAYEMSLVASRPAAGGLVVTVRGGWPRMRLPLAVILPWSSREDLGTVRLDRRGRGTLTDPPGGALDRLIGERPAGVASPVRVVVTAGLNTASLVRHRRSIRSTVALALPPPPTLAVTPQPVGADGAATLTVSGAEAGARYELWGRWRCADGSADERDVALQLPPLGAGPTNVAVDLASIASGRFAGSCAGSSPPPTLDATIELRRFIRGSSRVEVAAATPVTLSPPA